MSKVAIIGGCGRLGLKLSLICANKGHNVTIIDIDEERVSEVKQGNLPFIENGAEIYLEQALKSKSLKLTSENDSVNNSEVVIITIGTPVDSNLNPSLEPVAGIIFDVAGYLKEKQLLIFRNTLSPAIVGRIKTLIEDKTGFMVGKDIYLAFAPELMGENSTIHNLANAPQPIGAFDGKSFEIAKKFFETITKGKITQLNPQEAQLSKLMNNMYSYIHSACANEFYLVSEGYGANFNKIMDSMKQEAQSMKQDGQMQEYNTPNPNPNASGPGMHKEGWFLVDRVPFSELVTTAFKINESMPNQIIKKLENYKLNKVVILGMTTKPNSDETSSSLSYKLRKALYYKDYDVACYDPLLVEFSDSSVIQNADAVILMTAHNEFKDLGKIKKLVNNPNCIYVDIQGFWNEMMQKAMNGIFQMESIKEVKETKKKAKK